MQFKSMGRKYTVITRVGISEIISDPAHHTGLIHYKDFVLQAIQDSNPVHLLSCIFPNSLNHHNINKIPWTETSIWVDLSLHWILLQTSLYSLRSCSLKLTPVFWYTRRAPPSTSDQYAAISLTDVTNVPSESNLFSLKRNQLTPEHIFFTFFCALNSWRL